MSCMASPDDKANDEEAVQLLWAEYCSVLIPASVSMDFIQRPIVAGVTGLYGFNRLKNSFEPWRRGLVCVR